MSSMLRSWDWENKTVFSSSVQATSSPLGLRPLRHEAVQGIFQIVPRKPSGDCNVDVNQDMELTLAGFCSVSGQLKS